MKLRNVKKMSVSRSLKRSFRKFPESQKSQSRYADVVTHVDAPGITDRLIAVRLRANKMNC